jgi:ATP-dependent helicase/nuclease subunit A
MTAEREWTAEQLRAIERRTGDLLLDASAGSGKTSVLVERFARCVLDDGVDVSAILTITFTEKAAAELRDRIRARLRELGASEEARATEGAFISTIHGFCARVLRAGSLAAGLDPGFVVLDRDQSEPLAATAFDDALGDLARLGSDAVDLIADYTAGGLRAAILSIYGQLRSSGQASPRLPVITVPASGPSSNELAAATRALAVELGTIADPGSQVVYAIGMLERLLELLAGPPDLWPGELDQATLRANGAALNTDACESYRDALAAYRAACAARVAGPVRDLMDTLLAAFGERYAERKRAVSGVDFEDLELLALQLLRQRPEIRQLYSGRFERIMVDEFQDTNRVQLDVIESIARGNLFTVGDAQQSIYGFRHADVELFELRGQALEARGERETLQTNFRSRPAILSALDVAFTTALGERFRPLLPGRPDNAPGDSEPAVELLLVDKGAEWELEGLAAPWRLAEARALAGRVATLVASGTPPGEIVVLIRATTDMRAYERALERRGLPTYVIGGRGYWSHPQVLDLVSYLRALANPRDEESLLTVLASPLVGASLDALVVLAGAARARGRDPWWLLRDPGDDLADLGDTDRGALSEFSAWFAEERLHSGRAGIEELIDRALTRTGYDVAMLAMPSGRRRLANVRKLMRLGREYEAENGPDLRGFLDVIGERQAGRGGDPRESEAPVEGEGLNAIRLMTIHRAKGLEFPTVCVADLGRSVRPLTDIIRVASDGRFGLRLSRSGTADRVNALDFEAIGNERKLAEEAEERRLFYVAMTRAQERLVLSGATRFEGWTAGGRNGGGPVAWIAPAFVPELGARIAEGGGVIDLGGARVRLTIAVPNPEGEAEGPSEPPDQAIGSTVLVPGPPPALPPRIEPAPVSTLSYTALGAYARCGYRFYAERVLGLPPTGPERGGAPIAAADRPGAPAMIEPGRARSGAERGVLVHALLESLVFRRPVIPGPDAVAAAAAWEGLAPPPAVQEAEELAELIRRFSATELCARLAAATETRREERFAFPLEGGVLVTGAIDVLARESGGRALVVDYKSDRLDGARPSALVERAYTTQRLIYALAALHAGADVVEVAYCFLEAPEEPVMAEFQRAQRPVLEQELDRLAGGVLRREFAVSDVPHRDLCAGCPAEGGLCSWPLDVTRREAPDRLF